MSSPRVLAFDSGFGGLTVHRPLAAARPDIDLIYLADDAGFPYGRLKDEALIGRVGEVIGAAIAEFCPDVVLIACNTASTLALSRLRLAHPATPFVGTVPAIKPAAAASRTRRISVLATAATVARDYTRQLIADHAGDCLVDLVPAPNLAAQAERHVRGLEIDATLIDSEIAPAFVDSQGRRTDTVVLACTHFPLLIDVLRERSRWPVAFVDPGEAIARRVDSLLPLPRAGARGAQSFALTSERPVEPSLARYLAMSGIEGRPIRLRTPAASD